MVQKTGQKFLNKYITLEKIVKNVLIIKYIKFLLKSNKYFDINKLYITFTEEKICDNNWNCDTKIFYQISNTDQNKINPFIELSNDYIELDSLGQINTILNLFDKDYLKNKDSPQIKTDYNNKFNEIMQNNSLILKKLKTELEFLEVKLLEGISHLQVEGISHLQVINTEKEKNTKDWSIAVLVVLFIVLFIVTLSYDKKIQLE